ncbi:MAG: TetR/AcrR family transcriptional regulator [Bdellovibrionota bacterium]
MSEAKAMNIYNERSSRTTRDNILDTAVKIVSSHGIEGLTIGELAKAVGMSKSGLFAHFGGKDQLQLSVLELATERFVDVVMREGFKAPRGEPRIKAMFKNWLDHLNDESKLPGGSILIAASIELDDRPGTLRDFVQNAQKDLIANIEKAAEIAVEEGHFRKDLDVELFAWSLYSFVLGYHHFKRMLEDPKAELHVKKSFNGLLEVARAPVSARAQKAKTKPKLKNVTKLNKRKAKR